MTVDLTTLGFLSSCTEAFLNKDQKLLELIPETHPFHSIENAINGKMNFDKNKRKTLVDVIKKQYENIIVITGYNPTIIVKIFILTLFCNANTYRRLATYNENNAINANNGIYVLYLIISSLICLYLNINTYAKLAIK